MSYKTIAIVVTDQALDAAALAAACQLARREGAHLEVHALGIDQARLSLAPMGGVGGMIEPAMIESERARALEAAEALAAWAKIAVGTDPIACTIHPQMLSDMKMEREVAQLVRYSDLVVAARPYGKGGSNLAVSVVEAALFGSDAPVMIVPPSAPDLGQPLDRVMVAWNGGAEGLSAVRRALPTLQQASRVDIVIVDPDRHAAERSDPGGGVCLMLARHGVKAEVAILSQTLPRASDVLLRFAREHDVQAIVMGAYGHSRFREMVLGGVTRSMLEQTELPLLMAH